ncbi:MAG TPA: CDP-glucose 4,6-dehydratase [Rubrivivax sp.]|nr:CDP-glucose 4,6-dehydratase [Rubrivivax sp.]
MNAAFWQGRRVFVTGHTGFKGAWLCLWLRKLGAKVCGYALPPPTMPSLYALADAGSGIESLMGDVRDAAHLTRALSEFAPEVVLHMAARSVVLSSHEDPADTFATNVMGTVNLLDAVRRAGVASRRLAVVNVTTDKVYLNQRWPWGYRETDTLGGRDPYSSSKACSELVTQAYVHSFFAPRAYAEHGVAVGSARAGNVVGGGDWTPHQLVPAIVAAATSGSPVVLRNPSAVRPWQYVLDCLHGYLTLAEQLHARPDAVTGDWNFGPAAEQCFTVAQVAESLARHWHHDTHWVQAAGVQSQEEHQLRLDSSKAGEALPWRCELDTATALAWVAQWHQQVHAGESARVVSESQIGSFMARLASNAAA